MDKKLRFPCTNHVRPAMDAKKQRLKDRPLDEQFLTPEEFESLYDGRCEDCRSGYKDYTRLDLYTDKVLNWRLHFNPIITIKWYWQCFTGTLTPTHKTGWRWALNRIFKECIYGCHKGYDGCWYSHRWFLFFEFICIHYEIRDLIPDGENGFTDLSKLKEYKYNDSKYDDMRKHQLRVVKRYYRMFGGKNGKMEAQQ